MAGATRRSGAAGKGSAVTSAVAGVGGSASLVGLLNANAPLWLAVLVFLVGALPGLLLVGASVWERHKHQQLHNGLVELGKEKAESFEQVLALMADSAATHPDHLGTRLPLRKPRS